ncbi:MAG: flippase-like domain-containing protein [Bacteroidales bacterium]|nr:flippase-like domain-containing protein [Bacteroidales bacterium]
MSETNEKILKQVSPKRIIIPIAIGLSVAGYMLYNEWDSETFSLISIGFYSLVFLLISFIMMLIRDLGYMVRLKVLAGESLSWKSVLNIVLLWEFTSAVTPSAIGGTSVAVFFIHKEGVSVGKSSAIVLATSILDEFYFILMFPLLLLVINPNQLFIINPTDGTEAISFANKYFYFATIGYSIKLAFLLFVAYGLFINPKGIKTFLVWIFKLPILRRWKQGAEKTGDDIILASHELKTKNFLFWFKAFGATFFSWSARYWVVNFLLLALLFGIPNQDYVINFGEHMLIFARQLVMWIMMLVMPTPGGSGFAEAIFSEYMAEFIPLNFVVLMALMWRLVTYYPYLFVGAIVVPRWVRKILKKSK